MVIVELRFSGSDTGHGALKVPLRFQPVTFMAEGHTLDIAVNKAVHKLSTYLSKKEIEG